MNGEFVIASGEATKLFDSGNEPFNEIWTSAVIDITGTGLLAVDGSKLHSRISSTSGLPEVLRLAPYYRLHKLSATPQRGAAVDPQPRQVGFGLVRHMINVGFLSVSFDRGHFACLS